MRIRTLVLGFAAAAAAGAALAEQLDERAALFGIEMAGYYEGDGHRWRECIEPGGRTVYVVDERVDEGRLEITAEGAACFRYRSSDYRAASCFAVARAGEGLRFTSAPGAPAFVTTEIRRGVRSCPRADALIG